MGRGRDVLAADLTARAVGAVLAFPGPSSPAGRPPARPRLADLEELRAELRALVDRLDRPVLVRAAVGLRVLG